MDAFIWNKIKLHTKIDEEKRWKEDSFGVKVLAVQVLFIFIYIYFIYQLSHRICKLRQYFCFHFFPSFHKH